MNRTPIISNQKIIFFVVFVCAALMSSLFIYHSSQKPVATLSPDVGLIFPAPREIKTFELAATNNQAFTDKNLRGHWTLLFFGFTHCSSICPTTLDVLNRVYTDLQTQYPTLQVALISVDPTRDTIPSLKTYVETYNPAFIGVTGKLPELRKLQSQLGIYAAPDDAANSNYQIQHTSSVLLINPQGKWSGLFKYGLKTDEMVKGIRTGIEAAKALS